MDILDSLRQAPSAEVYRLYLAVGKMLDDARRILEVRQRLNSRMPVSYIADNPLAPPAKGTVVKLLQTQAVIQGSVTQHRWAVLYAVITPGTANHPLHVEPAPPPSTQREEFFMATQSGSPTNIRANVSACSSG
jgi:hypothetical protein